MIRRLFWLTLGAAAGVIGYRRVSRLLRAIQALAGRPGRGGPGGADPGLAAFLRDVRDGMEQYEDRRRAGPAGTARSYCGTDFVKDGR